VPPGANGGQWKWGALECVIGTLGSWLDGQRGANANTHNTGTNTTGRDDATAIDERYCEPDVADGAAWRNSEQQIFSEFLLPPGNHGRPVASPGRRQVLGLSPSLGRTITLWNRGQGRADDQRSGQTTLPSARMITALPLTAKCWLLGPPPCLRLLRVKILGVMGGGYIYKAWGAGLTTESYTHCIESPFHRRPIQ